MKKIFLISTMLLLFTGCDEGGAQQIEEEPQNYICDKIEGEPQNPICGKWDLIKEEAGFSRPISFNPGEISWDFQQNNILKVKVANTVSSPSVLKGPGEYKFSINGDILLIDTDRHDSSIGKNFSIDENVLRIFVKVETDGPLYTFSRAK